MPPPLDKLFEEEENIAGRSGGKKEVNRTEQKNAPQHEDRDAKPGRGNNGDGVNGFVSYEEFYKRILALDPNAGPRFFRDPEGGTRTLEEVYQRAATRAINDPDRADRSKRAERYLRWKDGVKGVGEVLLDRWKSVPPMG